jgi:hypothetical protein
MYNLGRLTYFQLNYPVIYVIYTIVYRNETVKKKEALRKVFILILIMIDFAGPL